MDERTAINALVSDLHWQIDQMPKRGIKDAAGNPYNPTYYKRGLQNAVNRGGRAVADYILGYLNRSPSDGYKKLEDADSLDCACEALIADETKPYAWLFTDEERAAARKRLAPYLAAIETRKRKTAERIERLRAELPDDVDALRSMAENADDDDAALVVAVNLRHLERAPDDVPSFIRLGRAYEALNNDAAALEAYEDAVLRAPQNAIANRRLADLERRLRSTGAGG